MQSPLCHYGSHPHGFQQVLPWAPVHVAEMMSTLDVLLHIARTLGINTY